MTISSGRAFQCLLKPIKYEDLCASVSTNVERVGPSLNFLEMVVGED